MTDETNADENGSGTTTLARPEQQELERHAASPLDAAGVLWEVAQRVHRTAFARKFNSAEEVFAAMMRGREVGLEAFQSLDSIDVIQGTPALKPEVMRALIRQQGHDYDVVEQSAMRCVIKAHRREWAAERWTAHEYTIEDARLAQLTGKDNWKKGPKAMLLARCTSQMARADFPDVIRGLSYTPEEVADFGPVSPAHDFVVAAETVEPEQRVDLSAQVQALDTGAKEQLKAWWKAELPAGTVPSSLPARFVEQVQAKITELALPDPNASAGDDEIVEAEIVGEAGVNDVSSSAEGGTTRRVPPPPSAPPSSTPSDQRDWAQPPPPVSQDKKPRSSRPNASGRETLNAVCRERGITPPQRIKAAAAMFGRPIKRLDDMSDDELRELADGLDTGEEMQAEADALLAGAFEGIDLESEED